MWFHVFIVSEVDVFYGDVLVFGILGLYDRYCVFQVLNGVFCIVGMFGVLDLKSVVCRQLVNVIFVWDGVDII